MDPRQVHLIRPVVAHLNSYLVGHPLVHLAPDMSVAQPATRVHPLLDLDPVDPHFHPQVWPDFPPFPFPPEALGRPDHHLWVGHPCQIVDL